MLKPPALEAMLTERVTRAGGREVALHSNINRAFAEALQAYVARERPDAALETGLAYGASALAILGGHDATRLVSVDPLQGSLFEGLGTAVVAEAGWSERHRVLERPSHLALPQLVEEGARIQLAYVDGWHTFDAALLDFLYVDHLLDVGGTVVFNDCWLPAVHHAIGFVLTHRDYREVDAGLPRTYWGDSRPDTVRRRVQGRRQEDRYLVKRSTRQPAWDFFRPFWRPLSRRRRPGA